MNEPDLSYLLRKSDPYAYSPEASSWPEQERRNPNDRAAGSVASLIAELRNSQSELDAQNKVLRYSLRQLPRAHPSGLKGCFPACLWL